MKPFTLLAIVVASVTAIPADHFGFAPNVSCPSGFQLNGKNCERAIYGTANIRCPLGALVNDQCVTHAPMTVQCPIGSVADGQECAVIESLAPEARCPSGYAPQGNVCAQQIPLNLITACDIGHDDGAGQCVQVEHAQKVIRTYCPAGYHDEGNGCMKMTDYDCSPPLQMGKGHHEQAVVSAPLALPIGGKKKGYKRMLGSRKYNVYAPPTVAAPPPSKAMVIPAPAVVAPPAPAIQVVHQQCQRKDFAPPVIESYCPDGFVEMGTSCQRISYYPPSQRCINGAPANACFDVKTVPRQVSCTKGALNGEVCQWKQPVPMERVCPAGTHPTGTGDCQQVTQPLATCPSGTQLDGRQCVGREIAEPVGQVTVPCTGKNCWH